MNPLQQWYEYVDRVSRPAAAPELPHAASAAPERPLPTAAGTPDALDPQLRARRYLAELAPSLPLVSLEWEWREEPPAGTVPELQFELAAPALPSIGDYLPERPQDRPPWDGDTRAWVRQVLNWFAAQERPPAPERPQPAPVVTISESLAQAPAAPAVAVECTAMRVTTVPQPAPAQQAPHQAPPAPAAAAPEDGGEPAPVEETQAAEATREAAAAPVEPRLPKHWELLLAIEEDRVAQHSYKVPFRETREEMVRRLLDPALTLEETARLLGVCPTTVRRYTNRGQLNHFRTEGNQRRFRLSDVLAFLEKDTAAGGQ